MTRTTVLEETTQPSAQPPLADPADAGGPMRYNVVLAWDSAQSKYMVSPYNMVMPHGFGTGKMPWPSPAYIKWYIIPKKDDVVTFGNAGNPHGISFAPPANTVPVEYDPENLTAAVQWTNKASGKFRYSINLTVNGHAFSIDPDVTNEAPPAPTP